MSETSDAIKKLAADVGYSGCGITTAEPFDDFARVLDEHIDRFPRAASEYTRMKKRVDPKASAPWANSIIVAVRWYGKYSLPEGLADHIGRNYLCDRRSKSNPDNDMPKRMKAGLKELGLRVKKGGVPDRAAALRAGVANITKNCFAYNESCGSWLNIETWRVDAKLPPDAPSVDCPCPEGCKACLDACPSRAITEPFSMDMSRCVAFATYGPPGGVADDVEAMTGLWVYGCDACQNACPLNSGKWETSEKLSSLEEAAPHLSPQAISQMTDEEYKKIIIPLFWYIPEDDAGRWRANAERALRNIKNKSTP